MHLVLWTVNSLANIVSCVNWVKTLVWWLYWGFDLLISLVKAGNCSLFDLDDNSGNFFVFLQLLHFDLVGLELQVWYHLWFGFQILTFCLVLMDIWLLRLKTLRHFCWHKIIFFTFPAWRNMITLISLHLWISFNNIHLNVFDKHRILCIILAKNFRAPA